jgi:hypothetical protein
VSSLYGFLKKSKTCAIGLIALLYIFTFMSCILPEPHDKTNVLPAFVAAAYEGKNLVSEQLRGCTFVIFINSTEAYHIDLLEKVYRDNSDNVNIIAFAGQISLLPLLNDRFPRAWIIDDSQQLFVEKFDARSCCGRFFIYDSSKQLIAAGNNTVFYEEGIRSIFRRIVDHISFDISILIPEQSVSASSVFRELWDQLRVQEKSTYAIFMLSDICGSCPVAKTISELSAALIKQLDTIGVAFLFSSDFSDIDIRNFKVKWSVPWPCIRADGDLALKWNDLIHDFSREELNQILLLVDSNGRLLATNQAAFKRLVEVK